MDPIHSPGSSISSPSPQVIDTHNKAQFAHYRDTQEAASNSSNSVRGNSSFSIDFILSNAAKAQDYQQQHNPDFDKKPIHHQQQQHQQRAQQRIDKMQQNTLVDQLNIININQQQAQLMSHLQSISASQSQAQAASSPTAPPPTAGCPNPLTQLLQQIGMNNNRSDHTQEAFRVQQQANSYFMACMLLHQYQQQQQQQANLISGQQASKAAAVAHQQQQANQSPIDSLALLARLTNSTAVANWLPTTSNYNYIPPVEASIQPGGKIRPLGAQRLPLTSPRRQPYPLPAKSQQHHFHIQPPPVFPPPPRCLNSSKSQAPFNSSCPPASSQPSNLPFPKTQSQERQQSSATNPIDQNSQQFWNCQQHMGKPPAGSFSSSQQMSQQSASNRLTSTSGSEKLDNLKPAHSYIGLIAMCILSDRDRRMVLNDIYQYILDHYPYYRNRGSGWRNSVRHNLSLNECFQKAGRAANGKGHYWTIHPANMEDFMNGDFRRRRAQRKVRRYNNMDVPSDESDDESMEDATRPPLPEHFKQSIEMHKRLEVEARMALMQDPSVQQQLARVAKKQREEMIARAAAMAALSAPVTVEHRATPVKDLLPVGQPMSLAATAAAAAPPPPRIPLPIEPGPLLNGNQ